MSFFKPTESFAWLKRAKPIIAEPGQWTLPYRGVGNAKYLQSTISLTKQELAIQVQVYIWHVSIRKSLPPPTWKNTNWCPMQDWMKRWRKSVNAVTCSTHVNHEPEHDEEVDINATVQNVRSSIPEGT